MSEAASAVRSGIREGASAMNQSRKGVAGIIFDYLTRGRMDVYATNTVQALVWSYSLGYLSGFDFSGIELPANPFA